MPQEVRMPSLGQTTEELRIVAWLKAEGETVKTGEILLQVETDKATLEVESFASGTLLKTFCNADDIVQAGALLAYIGAPGEALPAPERAAKSPDSVTGPAQNPTPAPESRAGDILALPMTRRLAKEHGIELARVRGSGPGGRIEKRDVQALFENGGASEVEIPVSRQRQAIARRLTQSAQTIPQITLTMTVDMSKARAFLTARRAAGLQALTYTHLILRGVASALREHSTLNRLWRDAGPTFRQLARADVGLAVAGQDSLLVVTLPEPDCIALPELVRATEEAVRRARSGALSPSDTLPTALTISNLGMYGVDSFDALVDPDQTAILAVGRVAEQVAVIGGGIHIVPQMQMSLTVDHRVVDGAPAAEFLRAIRERLENFEG